MGASKRSDPHYGQPPTLCWLPHDPLVDPQRLKPHSPKEDPFMKYVFGFAMGLVMLAGVAVTTKVQTQTPAPRPAPTYESNIQGVWKGLHNKLLAMAKDTMLPEDKFGWRPH